MNDLRRLRRARLARRLFLGAVAIFVMLGAANVFGARSSVASDRTSGWSLEVEYPRVNRGGLPAPFQISITRLGGFDGLVTVRADDEYLDLFDDNGFDPEPDSGTSGAGYVEWSFEPPDTGDVLVVTLDARIEPGRRGPFDGWVEVVVDDESRPRVAFRTWIAP